MRTGPTASTLARLEGSLSGATFDGEQLIGVDPNDARPLLARYDLEVARRTLTRDALRDRKQLGLWRWHEILPVRQWDHVTTLGEGDTPLFPVSRLGRHLGLERLLFKAESLNPTGSFKARGMAVAVSRAHELGAKHLVAPSAGNAGGALAAYAAAAGVRATVVMPTDAPESNNIEVAATGAQLVLVDGLISDCGRLASKIAGELGAFDLSTLKEPYRLEGKKTMGCELAEQLGWRLPDAVIYPTGGGTGLVGMWKAFAELEELGLIGSNRPRIFSIQTDGCAPIARAFASGARFADPWSDAKTDVAGLRVPSAVGDFLILDAVRASGGAAIAVPDSEIAKMRMVVGEFGAGYPSLETAAAVLGAEHLLRDHLIDRAEEVVVFDTGAGHKSISPTVELPKPVRADGADWDRLIDNLRNRQ